MELLVRQSVEQKAGGAMDGAPQITKFSQNRVDIAYPPPGTNYKSGDVVRGYLVEGTADVVTVTRHIYQFQIVMRCDTVLWANVVLRQ